ncbi:TIGR04086 family membrane protein [Lihuaxuella thermophila]|uniref:Putative membrane protein, TIGR04086 family n=1 Tax=Lihuaxuella thermophila TaxID=1173111 RepID=A0A1H8FU76_9BACL|nr:TIGR04086 family membrane protein [Lihuaxuella thermophila]SEN35371.1 putative membrane protein, TIGR04086 family [Lihuaxuella thermophila]
MQEKEFFLGSVQRGWRSPWVAGQISIWGVVLVCSFITALMMKFTSLGSSQLPAISYAINALALLLGGFISGRKAGQRGWYYGGLQGLIYAVILVLISFLAYDSPMMINPLVFVICAFFASALGGIFGVNTKK